MWLYKKLIFSLVIFISISILFFLKKTYNSHISSINSNKILTNKYLNLTCKTWKNFSFINITKYQKCLTWKRNDAFWSVEGIRHTAFKNYLNSSSLIIEIGGNTGHDTSKFIQLYNPFIISFEPLIEMSKNLKEKFKTNSKIEIQPYGLGSYARNISIEPYDSQNMGTSIFRKISSNNSSKLQQIQILNIIEVIENIRKTKTLNGIIDMISINCEGCEFEILPALLINNLTQYIRIIQFGSHMEFFTESSCIYCQIEQFLDKTHTLIYHYVMLWEAWILKNSFS